MSTGPRCPAPRWPPGPCTWLAAIRDTGGSHAERKRLTAIILKRATDAARQILEA